MKKLLDKLKTLIKGKLKPELFSKYLAKLKKLRRSFGVFGLSAVGLLVVLVAGVNGWFYYHPIEGYREKIVEKIKLYINPKELKMGELSWLISARSLSIGLKIKNLELDGYAFINKLDAAESEILFEPLKIFLGRLPVRFEMKKGNIEFENLEKSAEQFQIKNLFTNRWGKNLRLLVVLDEMEANVPLTYLGPEAVSGQTHIACKECTFNFSSFPGQFRFKFDTEVSAHLNEGRLIIEGPSQAELNGFFQTNQGQTVGIKIKEARIDGSELNIDAFHFVKKVPGIRFELSSSLQGILDNESALKEVRVEKGRLAYDVLWADFEGAFEGDRTFELKWNFDTAEASNIHLPFRGLYGLPAHGIVEANGSFLYKFKSGWEAMWKLSLNNLKFNPKDMSDWVDPLSKGLIRASLVSEGEYKRGVLVTPRTELLFDGTESQLEFMKGKIIKPLGDPLELNLKLFSNGDHLEIGRFYSKIHTLSLDAHGSVEELSKLLQAKSSSVNIQFQSNRIDLAEWPSYFPVFKKIPVEGNVQIAGGVEGPIDLSIEDSLKDLEWRVDRLSMSKIRGAFDRESMNQMEVSPKDLLLNGPFLIDFLFQGRGRGSVVHRASLLSQLDLTKTSFIYRDTFRKAAQVPMLLDISADQSRNQLNIRRGSVKFEDWNLNFSGEITHGSKKNRINLQLSKPVLLTELKKYLVNIPADFPFSGKVMWAGHVGFEENPREGDINWKDLNLEGQLNVENVGFQFPKMKYPIRGATGSFLFSSNGFWIPNLNFETGDTKVALSGEMKPLQGTARAMDFVDFLSRKAWDVSGQVSVTGSQSQTFFVLPEPENITKAPGELEWDWKDFFKRWLAKEGVAKSKVKLVLSSLEPKKKEKASSLMRMIFQWNHQVGLLEPIFLKWDKGQVKGRVSFDAKPYYERKDLPEVLWALDLEKVETSRLLKYGFAGLGEHLSGEFSGRMELSARGYTSADWSQAFQGRIQGTLNPAQYDLLSKLSFEFDQIFEGKAKDYLVTLGNRNQCFQGPYRIEFDGQIKNDSFALQKTNAVFASKSQLGMVGFVNKGSEMELRGRFEPSLACLNARVRKCLAPVGEGEDSSMLFDLKGTWNNPQITYDHKTLSDVLYDCLKNKVAGDVQKAFEKSDTFKSDRNEEAKLKKIYKKSQ